MSDERDMLLARLKSYRHALALIVELEDNEETPAEELLITACNLAEKALAL